CIDDPKSNDQIERMSTTLQPPLRAGQTLDLESLYAKAWPGKPSLTKLSEELILQIPPQYHQFWKQRDSATGRDLMVRPPVALDKIPKSGNMGFVMHLPDYEGYRPDNYLREFDEDEVLVYQIQPAPMSSMEADAAGTYPPNAFKRLSSGEHRFFDPEKFEDKHGLRCYDVTLGDNKRQFCYGRRNSELEEYLILNVLVPPYGDWIAYPLMSTNYFTPRYGGLEIAWRAHAKHLQHWREIDAQIWKYIEAWNIAPEGKSSTPIEQAVKR
ncbi:MAG: hypothetical protein CFE44_20185, partial [Burkholderiales bacterium PBB4]